MPNSENDQNSQANWIRTLSVAELEERTKTVLKLGGKQILVLRSGGKIFACNNRCPHEGFPLAEGTLSEGCILTCNWHSWRFNLEDGNTLVGGDALRLYPHEIRDGEIWLDLSDPPREAARSKALIGMREAFDEHDYERIARELTRFVRADGDPLDALAVALEWAMHGLEFGTTHAHAAAPDWLALRTAIGVDDAIDKLIPGAGLYAPLCAPKTRTANASSTATMGASYLVGADELSGLILSPPAY